MVTSGAIYHLLRFLTVPVDIRNICVLLAPAFSGLTAYAAYLLTNELTTSSSAGLLAAAFLGITPGYISRSVAGSYDNEAIAIFLLVLTFFLWVKAVKLGSVFWGALCALIYGYMVASWGGYAYITNLIPLHAFILIGTGRFSLRLYIAYTTWYALGTLASMQVPFVGFAPVRTSEHMPALGECHCALGLDVRRHRVALLTFNKASSAFSNSSLSLNTFDPLSRVASSGTSYMWA